MCRAPLFHFQVIVGTIAIRGTHLDLKPPALGEFEAICKVFGSAAKTSSRAARALVSDFFKKI